MNYDLKSIIKQVNQIKPKTVFQLKDLIDSEDPSTNKSNGKQFKADVDSQIINKVISIGTDSSNTQWYVKTF